MLPCQRRQGQAQRPAGMTLNDGSSTICGVRHEYGLLRDDHRTQRETRPLEEGMVFNVWEIAEAFKLEYGVVLLRGCGWALRPGSGYTSTNGSGW